MKKIKIKKFLLLMVLFLLNRCFDENIDEFKKNYSDKGDKFIHNFYHNIIKNKNYSLLKNIILEDFSLYDFDEKEEYSEGSDPMWLGTKNPKDTIEYIKNKTKKYGRFIKYEIITKRFFYALEEGIYNIDYLINVHYEKVATGEIIIIGIKKNGTGDLKLIAYSSRIKKQN